MLFCECRDLVVRRAGRTVLSVERLCVPAGRVAAVVGPNGAGKTTLLEVLALLRRPDGGELRLWGELVRGLDAAPRRGVVMVMHPGYLFRASVLGNVLYGLRSAGLPRREARRRAAEAMETVGISAIAGRRAGELSAGERQRVNLARALALRPRALLLDEPTANVDSRCVAVIRDVLGRLRERDGTTVLHAAPSMGALADLSDLVIELQDGRVASVRDSRE